MHQPVRLLQTTAIASYYRCKNELWGALQGLCHLDTVKSRCLKVVCWTCMHGWRLFAAMSMSLAVKCSSV